MRNITGSPVEGDDFFNRPRDLARLQQELENDAHILLTAPRRVGKTSLVLRLCEQCREAGWSAAFLNVEGCNDELGFADKLVEELQRGKLHPEIMNRVAAVSRGIRGVIGGLTVAGVNVKINGGEATEDSTLKHSLESVFRKISADEKKLLIVVDEMPEFLINLSKQDKGAERVAALLHWLRELRQTHRNNIHWVFLGSIGLDSFVDGRNLRKTINDLSQISLEALRDEEADRFLEQLGRDNSLSIAPEIRQIVIHRLGWALPYFLQLVFHALRDLDATVIDEDAVDRAFASLLRPENLSKFDTWRQRLDEQLPVEDAAAAKVILTHVCQDPAGRTRAQILDALMAKRPQANPDVVEDQVARTLQILQRDGYLLEDAGKYSFRSFLLREYWYRREVR